MYLLPGVVKSWAPIGEPPVLHHGNIYTHLSLISAVSPEGDFVFQLQETSYTSADVIAFLEHLHATTGGKLLVVWDSAPIHRSLEIKEFLTAGAAAWLRLEALPGYAPDLNPDEGIWNHLKYVELKNQCFQTLAPLREAAETALAKIKATPEIVKGCFRQARLC